MLTQEISINFYELLIKRAIDNLYQKKCILKFSMPNNNNIIIIAIIIVGVRYCSTIKVN